MIRILSNNRLEEVCGTLTKGTFSSRLLLSNQDKGCTPSVAHSLPLPLGPALLNLSSNGYGYVKSTCKVNQTHLSGMSYIPPTPRNTCTIVESGLNAKEIEMGTTKVSTLPFSIKQLVNF